MNEIDEIKQRLDIVELISQYVSLRQAGRTYKGLCPFHSEKTPSFVVFPDTGTWHCFGACGSGGDAFAFLMKQENLDFREVLQVLADRTGVALAAQPGQSPEEEDARAKLYAACRDAAAYWQHLLRHTPQAQAARDYLAHRGLDDETLETFQIGYALDQWDACMRYLMDRGHELDDLITAGLVTYNEERDTTYDRFRGRIIFPIRDIQTRVIGFGARAMGDAIPKYLNSPQTPLFDKSHILYALDLASRAIRQADQTVIVEGYMDAIAAHQHGQRNVVAAMGTALTEPQLRQLKRYTRRFTLALDADAAGQAATLRGLEQAREALSEGQEAVFHKTLYGNPAGLVRYESRLQADLRIMTLPAGLDPDDLIRKDVERWLRLLDEAQPIVDYYFALIRRTEDLNTAQGKAQAVQQLAPLVYEVSDPVQRAHYVTQLARLVRVDERTIEQQVRQAGQRLERARRREAAGGQEATPTEGETRLSLEDHVLAHILREPEMLLIIDEELSKLETGSLSTEDFRQSDNREIFERVRAGAERWDSEEFRTGLPGVLYDKFDLLFAYAQRTPPLLPEHSVKDAVNTILRLRQHHLRHSLQELRFLLAQAQEEADVAASQVYHGMVRERTLQIGQLQTLLSQRTLLARQQSRSL